MLARKNYSQLHPPVGPYVHATIHNGVFYSSGMTAFGTSADNGSVNEQVLEIFRQLNIMLQSENSSLKNLIKVTIFVTDLSVIIDLRETLFETYGAHIPASSIVEVKNLFSPSVKIEIEAIAAIPL
jgi:2-iminobutanoate/2-iminopropanoate deaminase